MADNWPMETGGVGETIGVALVAVGLFVGWRYGPRAQKKYEWIFGRVALVSLAGSSCCYSVT
jgi:hypothetical protein